MSQQNNLKTAEQIYHDNRAVIIAKTDRLFGWLFLFQWILGVVLALWLTPLSWRGEQSQLNIHLYAAIFLGALIAALPIYLGFRKPGFGPNRYVMTVAQMSYSIMLIHITGGRIETHFHIFGSLAFLASYRDVRPLILGTLITIADHTVRGVIWPISVYGVLTPTYWRALEHGAWVLFEDIILILSIRNSSSVMRELAENKFRLQYALECVEHIVQERTSALIDSQQKVLAQQEALMNSSKLSAIGEMASGIAHEVNNPLGLIQGKANLLLKNMERQSLTPEKAENELRKIVDLTKRIAKIVNGLRSLSRQADHDPFESRDLLSIIEEVRELSAERFSTKKVALTVEAVPNAKIHCRPAQVEQVLVNLLNNSIYAVSGLSERWVRLEFAEQGERLVLSVTDSGRGIPREVVQKLMQPFFTTKPKGDGTGLGLSISKKIIEEHRGRFYYDESSPNTRFVIELPLERATISVGKAA